MNKNNWGDPDELKGLTQEVNEIVRFREEALQKPQISYSATRNSAFSEPIDPIKAGIIELFNEAQGIARAAISGNPAFGPRFKNSRIEFKNTYSENDEMSPLQEHIFRHREEEE